MKIYPMLCYEHLLYHHITAMDEVGRNSHVSLCLSRMEAKTCGKKTVTEYFSKKNSKTAISAPKEKQETKLTVHQVVTEKMQTVVKRKAQKAKKRSVQEMKRNESLSIPVFLPFTP